MSRRAQLEEIVNLGFSAALTVAVYADGRKSSLVESRVGGRIRTRRVHDN